MARSSARVRCVYHDSNNETRITTSLNQDHCHHRVEITSYGYEAIQRIKKKTLQYLSIPLARATISVLSTFVSTPVP